MITKKILVISNNAFSNVTSNGRTLKNFFDVSDKEKVAQFYIQFDAPDFGACLRYFNATDREVLNSVIKFKSAGKKIDKSEPRDLNFQQNSSKKVKRTPFTMLVRSFFWNRKVWRKKLIQWVEEFSPECVLLQAGDSPFMFNISVDIAKKFNIPFVIYNSEDYYFKKYNYFRSKGFSAILYPIFRKKLKKSIRRAIKYSSKCIYATEELKNLYDDEFGTHSEYLYTGSEISPKNPTEEKYIFSYLGNLGLNRHKGLIEIAKSLNNINSEFYLDVYGKMPNMDVNDAFEKCHAIKYHGMVDYETVKTVIEQSMILFHTESFDDFYVKDICHGFTTKIADSLSSGTCFAIYAPPTLTCTKYLIENKCACVITNKSELQIKLKELIENADLRKQYIEQALNTAKQNHNFEKNKIKFSSIINDLKEN